MNILILGGTRFTGRAVAIRLLSAGHAVTVSSRRPENAPTGVAVIGGERTAVLSRLSCCGGYDLVIDFTAYDADATVQALAAQPKAKYLLISSTWLTQLEPQLTVDAQISEDAVVPNGMPKITQTYLHGKAAAERSVLSARRKGRAAAVLRLPILGGANDHTGRLNFYRRRVEDGGPVILVDGGQNRTTLLWSEDVAAGIERGLNQLFEPAILDGIPDAGHSVKEVIELIARAAGKSPCWRTLSSSHLQSALPAYLEHEPLWREQTVAAGSGNLFVLSGHKPSLLAEWITIVMEHEPPRAEIDDLRARELELLQAETTP